jgi:hypothetical protein
MGARLSSKWLYKSAKRYWAGKRVASKVGRFYKSLARFDFAICSGIFRS